MTSLRGERSEFYWGGKPLAAALIGVACGASPIPFNVLPLIIGPISQEFNWTFAQASAGMTVFGIIAALMAPLFGGFSDKFGVKPVVLWSLFLFGIGFGSFYFLPSDPTQYVIFWGIVGLIGIGSTPVTFSRAISMWFSKNRGLALGIMLLGTSLSAMVVPQIAQKAIETGGWRWAFPAVAVLPLFVALPLAYFWFREPRREECPQDVTDSSFMIVFIAAFLLGFAAGTESDIIAYLASRYFGMAHYGRIYGTLYMPFAIGAAISPILYGMVRDSTGNYDLALIAAAGGFIFGGTVLLTLGRYPTSQALMDNSK
jgi:MFS family permease